VSTSCQRVQGREWCFPGQRRPREAHLRTPLHLLPPLMTSFDIHSSEHWTHCSCVPTSVISSRRWMKNSARHLALVRPSTLVIFCATTPRLDHNASPVPTEQPSSFRLRLLCWLSAPLLEFFDLPASVALPSSSLLLVMPLLRGKPKRGPLWYQTYGCMANRVPPVVLHQPPSSSTSSSSLSSSSLSSLPPLSSPWACRVEWFDHQGHSLGFTPGTIQDLASSSQTSMVPLTPPPELSAPLSTTLSPHRPLGGVPHPAPLVEPPTPLEEPPGQPHSCSDYASCSHVFSLLGRYYMTWSLQLERMWTTCTFGWRTWTGEGT
jgi:hypothetical protein